VVAVAAAKGFMRVQPGASAPRDPEAQLLTLAAAAERLSEHPLGRAIVDAAAGRGLDLPQAEALRAEPGRGVVARVNGQQILVGNQRLLHEQGIQQDEATARWVKGQHELGRTVVYVAVDGQLAGAIALADRPREDAAAAVAALRRQGLRIVIASGDHEGAVAAAAREVGVDVFHARLLPEDKRRLV